MLEWLEVRLNVGYDRRLVCEYRIELFNCDTKNETRMLCHVHRQWRHTVANQPHYFYFYYFYALVLYSQGLKISKCVNVCPERLRWVLRNCKHVGKAH